MVDGAAGREAAGPEVGPDPRRWWALAVLCLGLSVVSIDNTIVTTALPEIQRELGATQSDLARIADGYTVVFAALLLACGSLADRRGRKLVLDIGLVLFALTSAGAAFAPTPALLSLARVAMGAAGALIMPATLSILMATFLREEREGPRDLDGEPRPRHRSRSPRRRHPARALLVGVDLPREPADLRDRARGVVEARADFTRPVHASRGRARHRAVDHRDRPRHRGRDRGG